MRKEEMGIWDILSEILSILGLFGFFGLQIYCGTAYHMEFTTIVYNLAAVFLIYIGFMVLQFFPELLNGTGGGTVTGQVRVYGVRMIRTLKLVVVYGVLVPSICDALGMEINAAYSLIILALILVTIGYYIFRIWKYNKTHPK